MLVPYWRERPLTVLAQALLTQWLFMSVTLLGPHVDAKLLERWFLSSFPKFANLRPGLIGKGGDQAGGQTVLDQAVVGLLSGLFVR
jgi:hypothetical protein